MKIRLEESDLYSDIYHYTLNFIVEKDGEEYDVAGTLSVMQDSNMAVPDYHFVIDESTIDLTDEEMAELQDFARDNYKK